MGEHASRSPSKASMWTECPQSIAMAAVLPEEEGGSSQYAIAGTTAHWGGEETLKNDFWSSIEMVGQVCPDTGQEFSVDMVEAVDTYVNHVRQRIEEMGDGTEMHIEVKVNPGALLNGRDDCWGTADCILVSDDEMEVIDYKNGSGVAVEADDPQFALYAIGGIHEFGFKKKVTTTVVQPRKAHQDGPVRSTEWSDAQMAEWIDYFKQCLAATDDPDAPFNPGEEQCRWCRAKAVCGAHADYALRQAQVYFTDTPVVQADKKQVLEEIRTSTTQRAPSDLDLETVVMILDSAPMIRGWLAAVESYAQALLLGGHEVPGYKLVEGRSNRRWDPELDDEALQKKLRNLGLKKADFIEEKVRSVAQIEAMLKHMDISEVKKRNFAKLIVKPEGKVTIAPAADIRRNIGVKAEDNFQKQEKQDVPA